MAGAFLITAVRAQAQEGTDAPVVDAPSTDAPLTEAPTADTPATDGPQAEAADQASAAEPAVEETEATVGRDVPGEIDVSPASILEKVDSWVDGFIKLLPNIAVAILLLVVFYVLAVVVRRVFIAWARRRERINLGEVLGSFLKWLVFGIGILLALTVVIPTLNPGDLIAGLGVSSVAIGFAFKDILQNWLAGLLLLMRQPFEVGDQIIVEGYEGAVERIETRATLIRTYDGRRVLIPNSDVYTSAVLVNTAFDFRRSQADFGIGVSDDIDEARRVMLKAMEGLGTVERDPAPDVQVDAVGDFAVILRPRWWTSARRADVVAVRTQVVTAIKEALDAAGIDMPYETQVHLFHDQTEEVDGRRGEQREGWPADPNGERPRSRQERMDEQRREETHGSSRNDGTGSGSGG